MSPPSMAALLRSRPPMTFPFRVPGIIQVRQRIYQIPLLPFRHNKSHHCWGSEKSDGIPEHKEHKNNEIQRAIRERQRDK
jgi:hypothetical protein